MKTLKRAFVAPSRLALLASLALLSACGTYRPYHYSPEREVHEFHRNREDATPDARVTAEIVGVMRSKRPHPPRVHARLTATNDGTDAVTLLLGETELRPTDQSSLRPVETVAEVPIPTGEERVVDLFFVLPSADALPRSALGQLTLIWRTRIGEHVQESEASFERTPYARYAHGYSPYYGYPWGYRYGFHGPYPYGFYAGYHVVYCY